DERATPIEHLVVVIAVHGAPRELPAQLGALRGQTVPGPWELVLADNGGGDLAGLVAGLGPAAADLPLRIVDATARPGQAAAMNAALRATTADAIVLLDADDVVGADYLATMWRALERHPFVAARLDCDRLNPPWLRESRPPTQTDGVGTPFGFLPSAAGCAIGLRRWAYDLSGGFDESIAAGTDVDLSWRLQLAGVPLTFVPDAVVHYRYRSDVKGIFRQAATYGEAGPVLFREHRGVGMPRRRWRSALRFHFAGFGRLVRVRSKADAAAAVFLVGFRIGLIRGSVRHRTVYL
nr:glycosyltransferase family 2 protein [Acidimicrobiia bacterium]